MFAVDCDGREVVTIEGRGGERDWASACATPSSASGAVQCGFCTPGLMVQASHVLEQQPARRRGAIRRGIEGNLCRCTGYRKIIDAIALAAAPRAGATHGSR